MTCRSNFIYIVHLIYYYSRQHITEITITQHLQINKDIIDQICQSHTLIKSATIEGTKYFHQCTASPLTHCLPPWLLLEQAVASALEWRRGQLLKNSLEFLFVILSCLWEKIAVLCNSCSNRKPIFLSTGWEAFLQNEYPFMVFGIDVIKSHV